MKNVIVTLAILASMCNVISLFGQQQLPNCDEDDIFCDIQGQLNGFTESMFTQADITEGPSPNLCEGSGAPHNTSWFGFVAGTTSLTISFDLFNCDPGDCNGDGTPDCWGVQLGAYESCDLNNSVFCDVTDCTPPAIQDPTTMLYSYQASFFIDNLNVGDDYFVFLDGCAGSFCDYQISITGTNAAFTPEFDSAPNSGIACEDCNALDDICTGAEITFYPVDENGDEFDLSISYDWAMTVPNGGTFNDDFDGENDYTWTFDVPGNYTLCVTASTSCDANNEVCVDIVVADILDEDFGEIEVCEDVLNNGINPNDYVGSTDPSDIINNIDLNGDGDSGLAQNVDLFNAGVEMFTSMNSFGCEWDQQVEIVQIDNEEEIEVITYFCATDMVVLNGNPNVIIDQFYDEDEIEYTADNGCTAVYLVTAWELAVEEYDFLQGPCGDTGIEVFFDESTLFLEDLDLEDFTDAGGNYTWIWTREGADIPGSENAQSTIVPFGDTGRYSVKITLTIIDPWTGMEVSCEQTLLINTNFIIVDPQDSSPIVNSLFDGDACPEDSLSVIIGLDILGFDAAPGDFSIDWSFPADVTVISGGTTGDTSVELDYSNTLDNTVSNEVCWEVSGTCGMPTQGCAQVNFAPNDPPILDLQGLECPDGIFTVQANGLFGVLTDLDTIIWDFNGGMLVNGSDTSMITAGPLDLQWPGDVSQQIVTATVSYVQECLSYDGKDTINFIIDPPSPTLNCFSNQESMTFEWDPVDGAMEYIITDTADGSTQILASTETSITINGLAENECFTYTIEAVAGLDTIYCQTLESAAFECCTKECPAVTANLMNPYSDTICIGLNESIETFTIVLSDNTAGNGNDVFFGLGVDSSTGEFNPSLAGVGTHTIEYYFEYTDTAIEGCRTPLVSTEVTVVELPTFTMAVDNNTVCVDEPVVISFDGTYDPSFATNLVTNGATIIDDSDPQNIIVSWSTSGPKSITSEITTLGCGMLNQALNVTVDELPQINIQCMPTSSSITYTWNTDPSFDDYTVTVDDGSGPIVVTIGVGLYEVTGLNPGDGVLITVVGNSGNSCPDVTASENNCVAEDCAEINLTADGFSGTENICIDGTESPITITGTIDDPTQLSNPDPIVITANNMTLTGGVFDPTILGPGTYQIDLLLQDGNCPFFDSFVIEVEDVPVLDVDAPTRICITDTWELDYVGEVNGDFTYDWSIDDAASTTLNGSGDQAVDFDTPGVYNLTVNAATTNCASTEFTAMVEVIDSLTTPQIQCQESVGEILFSWTDGNDECAQTYSISINGTIVDNITDIEYLVEDLMPETPIVITVINESTDCVCENKQNTFTCQTLSCPTVAIEITDPTRLICRTSTETLPMEMFEVTSQDDISDYTITFGGDATTTGMINPNNLTDGLYTITATAVNGFCDAPASATLELVTIPSLAFDYEQEICVEDDLTVTYTGDALGTFDFEWSSTDPIGFAGQLSPVIMYDIPGDYSYTLTTMSDECPNGSTAIVAVTVLDSLRTPTVDCSATLDQIELTIGVEETNCPGDISVVLNGAPYTGDLTGGTILIEDLDAGTDFTLQVINSSQCGCSDKSVEVMCSTLPCPDFNFTQSCTDESLDSVTFEWSLDEPDCGGVTTVTVDGVAYTGDISSNSITIDGLDASTNVDFVVTYTSNCGCDETFATQTCTTDACPAFNFTQSCDGGIDFVEFTWDLDEPGCGGVTTVTVDGVAYTGDISTNQILIDGLTAGVEVDFQVTYTSNCGCDETFAEMTCETDPCPPLNLAIINPTTQWCLDPDTPQISYTLEVTADGMTLAPTNVVWSGLGINTLGNIDLAIGDVTAGIETYTADYTLAGCPYQATTTIQYIAQPTFEVEVVLPCPGETVATLNILNAEVSADIVYSLDGTPLSTLTNIPISEGPHLVESLAFGRCDEEESLSFTSQPLVEIEIVGDTMSFAGVENVYDIISNYNFDKIVWELNGSELDQGAPAEFAYFEEGQLCVTGFIDDCPTTACATVIVQTEKVFVSNIFNPFAPDPKNTTLQVFSNVEIKELAYMSVYDRWGNLVFHVENADPTDINSQWDGNSIDGDPLEQGVYIYAGEIEFLSGEFKQFVGDVTLVR